MEKRVNFCVYLAMCSLCRDILKGFDLEHTEARCPLRNSFYCSNCAVYGHLTTACYALPPAYYREPAFLEQLIPPSDVKRFGITTRTPLPVRAVVEEPPRLLEIKDNDKAIAAYLAARAIKSPKGWTKRRALEEYAKRERRRIVYVA